MAVSNDKEAVIEEKPDEKPHDLTLRALEQRIRQQEIMSELGVMALQGPPLKPWWPRLCASRPRVCG